MVSSRASEVAELLWELKKAQKIAKYSALAKQAGFSAGMNGRTMATTIRTIRRDWPHLEWWRAISDDGLLAKDSEHEEKLRQSGFELEEAKGKRGSLTIKALDHHLMSWESAQAAAAAAKVAAE
jgi:alkylated DNA nucleotide flippase Atl1